MCWGIGVQCFSCLICWLLLFKGLEVILVVLGGVDFEVCSDCFSCVYCFYGDELFFIVLVEQFGEIFVVVGVVVDCVEWVK